MIRENQRLIRTRENDHELTCIVCPIGCRMTIERPSVDEIVVTGNKCRRGEEYAHTEFEDPRRVVTGTCAILGARGHRLPVRSAEGVPVNSLAPFLRAMYELRPVAPVKVGDVIASDLAGTGIGLKATMAMEALRE